MTERRIAGLDLARTIAFFGMLLVNFRIAMGASEAGPGALGWVLRALEGHAAAMFVVLAGVSLTLFSKGAHHKKEIRKTLLKRSVFLFLLGLLNTTIFDADILHYYGIYIALGVIFLWAPGRILVFAASSFALAFPVLLMAFDYEKGWNWATLTYHGFWTSDGFFRNLFFNGFHPVIPWVSFLLAGMWLGRFALSDSRVRNKMIALGGGLFLSSEAVSHLLITLLSMKTPAPDLAIVEALVGTGPMPPMPVYLISAFGFSVGVIGFSILVAKRFSGTLWLKPFILSGQQTLTLYIAHIVLGMGLLEALGKLENQTSSFAIVSSCVFFSICLLFVVVWRKWFRMGPFELLMRKLTG
ncbi:MAG: heparan-alpha-glucosaminide N-acetyltransferase domain-containing protein [Bdellovibrionota bacterium]